MFDLRRAVRWLALLCALTAATSIALAQDGSPALSEGETPSLNLLPPSELANSLLGLPLQRIELVTAGDRWVTQEPLDRELLGQPLTAALARQLMRSLLASGRFAEVSAHAVSHSQGAMLRITVLPRRVVSELRVTGSSLGDLPTLEAAGIEVGSELTVRTLSAVEQRVSALYKRRGFPQAYTTAEAIETDDPMSVVLVVGVHSGPEASLDKRRFVVDRNTSPTLESLLRDYGVAKGERADEVRLEEADAALTEQLHRNRYPLASVTHTVEAGESGTELTVVVRTRAETHLQFEGNAAYDDNTLNNYLLEHQTADRDPQATAELLRQFYTKRGYLDAQVKVQLRRRDNPRQLHSIFTVREGQRVRVERRRFPCLSGPRSEADLVDEIDSFLSESLPTPTLLGPVDTNDLDRHLAGGEPKRPRAVSLPQDPYVTYHPETYDKALDHLTALFRSEGYLDARAGPVRVVRRHCDARSPAGACRVVKAALPPTIDCRVEAPAAVPDSRPSQAPATECKADLSQSKRCESVLQLDIPVVLGPRAVLWDLRFEGNRHLVEHQLAQAAQLRLGSPVSQLSLEEARRRIVRRYEEDGYAFVGVEATMALSPDRSRGQAIFRISERQPVLVSALTIVGARFTSEQLIESRIALKKGQLYRRSLARTTEDQLISLGVFTSVTVGLQDADVPSRDKVVVVTVQERLPQFLDVRPGFSTGQGLRVAFEYGHRNLLQRAIQLSFRLQLGYLPPELVIGPLQSDFQRLQEKESLQFLLQHRLSLTLGLPEMGLGPAYRLDVEGVRVRDIFQQFARDKTALLSTLTRRTNRQLTLFGGASLELNEADVYVSVLNDGEGSSANLEQLKRENQGNSALLSLLNIPDGLTFVVAQRLGFTWDLRDNPVAATSGTLLSFSVEHANAYPLELSSRDVAVDPVPEFESHFLQYSGRIGAYFPLSSKGLTLATSLRWGFNQQLTRNSETYPDRLFFMGGVNSLRGFNRRTVMPADVQRAIDEQNRTTNIEMDNLPSESQADTARTVAGEIVRGGNLLLNPRAELRIPLVGIWNTVLFLDTGNLWVEPEAARENFDLRYTAGTGLRATTPVGPMAIDVGFNLFPRSAEERDNLFALHFSIGLY